MVRIRASNNQDLFTGKADVKTTWRKCCCYKLLSQHCRDLRKTVKAENLQNFAKYADGKFTKLFKIRKIRSFLDWKNRIMNINCTYSEKSCRKI